VTEVVRLWRGRVARATYVIVGAAFGLVVSLTSLHRGTQPWVVWACLAIALAATSGAVFGYGLARWPEIRALGRVRPSRVAGYITGIVVAGLVMLALGAVLRAFPDRDPSGVLEGELSGLLLVTFAWVGALPVLAGLAAIHELAHTMDGTPGEQLEDVLTLRRLLAGLLAALGVQVTLETLALGAALQLGSEPASAAVVIVFGVASSVVVGVAYAPANGALRAAARALCRAVVPFSEVSPADLPGRTEDRRRLEQALGVDRGLFADLQSGVIVLAPLLASAAAAFLPD